MKISVNAQYYAGTNAIFEIPGVDSFDQIENWYVKWDTFYYQLKGESEMREHDMDCGAGDIDWKRPDSTEIFGVDEDGYTDYSQTLTGDE